MTLRSRSGRIFINISERSVTLGCRSHSSNFRSSKRTIITTIYSTAPTMAMSSGQAARKILSAGVLSLSRSNDKISRFPNSCNHSCHSYSNSLSTWRNRFSPTTANVSSNCKGLWTGPTEEEVEEKDDAKKTKVSKKTKKWNAPPDPSSPPEVTKAYTIKRLNKQNKDLFGELLETKQERVKRKGKELKLAKKTGMMMTREVEESQDESLLVQADDDKNTSNQLEMNKKGARSGRDPNLLKVRWLPRAESIKLEHAGMSINKNPIKGDVGQDNMMTGRSSSGVTLKPHKGAEIEWSLRNAPTKMKLIELSTTTSSPSQPNQDHVAFPEVADVNEQGAEIITLKFPSDYSATSPKLPSVTKILSATMPEEQAKILKRWEEKMIAQMGEEGFRQYRENILTNGKLLHSNIDSYLRGTPTEEISVAERNQGHWNSLSGILESVDHVQVLESHVLHPELQYCGVIDCVAEFRNRLVLIDWKTSQKPKTSISMTYDTPLQIAAYIGAINDDTRYSLKIDSGLIVYAYEDGSSCQTFMLEWKDIDKYWKIWLKRLELFRKISRPLS